MLESLELCIARQILLQLGGCPTPQTACRVWAKLGTRLVHDLNGGFKERQRWFPTAEIERVADRQVDVRGMAGCSAIGRSHPGR